MQIKLEDGKVSDFKKPLGGDFCSEGCGFESWHHKLDELFSHIFVLKIVMMFV